MATPHQTPEQIPAQWTTEGFMLRYEQLCRSSPTYFAAYQATEQEHINLFGQPRFSGYESFRNSFKNYLTRKLKNQ